MCRRRRPVGVLGNGGLPDLRPARHEDLRPLDTAASRKRAACTDNAPSRTRSSRCVARTTNLRMFTDHQKRSSGCNYFASPGPVGPLATQTGPRRDGAALLHHRHGREPRTSAFVELLNAPQGSGCPRTADCEGRPPSQWLHRRAGAEGAPCTPGRLSRPRRMRRMRRMRRRDTRVAPHADDAHRRTRRGRRPASTCPGSAGVPCSTRSQPAGRVGRPAVDNDCATAGSRPLRRRHPFAGQIVGHESPMRRQAPSPSEAGP